MSRREEDHPAAHLQGRNAVAKGFSNLLRRERIGRRIQLTHKKAGQDVGDCIARFHNPKRKYAKNGVLSPAECERQQMTRREGIQESRRSS